MQKNKEINKKIFIVTGELSGDKTAAWYLKRLFQFNKNIYCQAVGGDFLKKAGAILYKRFEQLNVTGFVEIASKIFFILKFLKNLSAYILNNSFDQVIIVDFPGFNLRLAKILKKKNPKIKIIYLAPPQLWIWGAWRIKKLKKYCDKLIVLYPFEVEWYKKRGIAAKFVGNPVYCNLKPYLDENRNSDSKKLIKNQIAFLIASRESELKKLFPFFVQLFKKFLFFYPDLKIILPVAKSLNVLKIENMLEDAGISGLKNFEIIQDEDKKIKTLRQSCVAISKPGTINLELSLLKIPTIVFYKTSWMTYYIAKSLVSVDRMSLPNLLLQNDVYKEFLQKDCTVDNIFNYSNAIYKSFLNNDSDYWEKKNALNAIAEKFL